jgi:hypothetical protein
MSAYLLNAMRAIGLFVTLLENYAVVQFPLNQNRKVACFRANFPIGKIMDANLTKKTPGFLFFQWVLTNEVDKYIILLE